MGKPLTARIEEWSAERGFGFLCHKGQRVFLHWRDFSQRHKTPEVGDRVSFEIGKDAHGRTCAKNAVHVNDGGGLTFRDFLIVAITLLMPVIALIVLDADLLKVGGVAFSISGVTFLAYLYDKKRAIAKGWRVAEIHLHLLELLGGWPGAFLAQRKFRHKCSKVRYQAVYWLIVLAYQIVAFDSLVQGPIFRSIRGR